MPHQKGVEYLACCRCSCHAKQKIWIKYNGAYILIHRIDKKYKK